MVDIDELAADPFLNPSQIAVMFGVRPYTVRQWISSHKLKAEKVNGRLKVFDPSDHSFTDVDAPAVSSSIVGGIDQRSPSSAAKYSASAGMIRSRTNPATISVSCRARLLSMSGLRILGLNRCCRRHLCGARKSSFPASA